MRRTHLCITMSTIMQKDVFDHNFQTKALKMTIVVSRSMFLRPRNPMVLFILTFDCDLCEITFGPTRSY